MRFITNQDVPEDQAIERLLQPRAKIAIDTETVSLENKLILGIAIAIDKDTSYYFLNTRDELISQVIHLADTVYFHNASFDVPALSKLGIQVEHWEDTMLMAYSAGILAKGLEDLSANLLHMPYTSVTTQWKKPDQGNLGIDHVVMGGWSMQHAMNTWCLSEAIPCTDLYKDIDRPSIELVIEMEHWGVLIDQYKLTLVEQETMVKVNRLEKEILDELGLIINLASNPQVAAALKLKGIIGTRKTSSSKDSVSDESLAPLHNPLTDKILKHRSLMKTISTYVPAFRNRVDVQGRLHTEYGYTNTGRWNSSNPNLQNITRDEKFEE